MVRIASCALACALLASACGRAGPGSHPGTSVTDSAGVRIVESRTPAWTDATAWRIDPAPVLSIGAIEGEEPYLLDTVSGLTRLDDGTIIAASTGSNDLRFFDANGRHIRSVGRAGDGPGEFRQILGMPRIRGDTLMVSDYSNGPRWSVFTGSGEFVRTFAPQPVRLEGLRVSTSSPFRDGSFIGFGWPQGNRQQTGTWTDSALVVRLDRDGSSPRPIGRLPARTFVGDGTRGRDLQFGPEWTFAAGPDHFFHNFTSSHDIERYDLDGNLQAIYRRAHTPQPVSQEMIDAFHDQFVNAEMEGGGTSPEWRAFLEQRFSEKTFADTLPAHGPMRVDRTGHLWVQHFQQQDRSEAGRSGFGAVPIQPSLFSIFDPDGVWLGDIETPGRFNILEIGGDYLLGISRDELGVEYIRIYALQRK